MDTLKPSELIISEFDRIALLPDEKWNYDKHYHNWILQQLPERCVDMLEIGCGTGELCRLLAAPARSIEGLDFSRNMIIRARQLSKDYPDINYCHDDFMNKHYAHNAYDCILCIASAHHNSLEMFFQKCADLLRPGGKLILIDLYQSTSFTDYLLKTIAAPLSLVYKISQNGRLLPPSANRAAWKQHRKDEQLANIAEIKQIADRTIPGYRIKRMLFHRYHITWTKS